MAKKLMKGSILFGPLPAVLVTCTNKEGKNNVFTVAWTGVVCSDPPMVSISVRKERLSHQYILDRGEFVINITTANMVKTVDYCGCKSGRTVDKIKHFGLELNEGVEVSVPSLEASPVALECKLHSVTELGTHDLFLAEIVKVKVDEAIINDEGAIKLGKAGLLAYAHGEYYGLNAKPLSVFGYSVARKSKKEMLRKRMK